MFNVVPLKNRVMPHPTFFISYLFIYLFPNTTQTRGVETLRTSPASCAQKSNGPRLYVRHTQEAKQTIANVWKWLGIAQHKLEVLIPHFRLLITAVTDTCQKKTTPCMLSLELTKIANVHEVPLSPAHHSVYIEHP